MKVNEILHKKIQSRFDFTSESVTCGHPDKVADQISDWILDECLKVDKDSRVACEVMLAKNQIILAWEITTSAKLDYEAIARKIVSDIWYSSDETYFNANSCWVINLINSQSSDIAIWVDKGWAWDQWIMLGYATDETENFMPIPIFYARKLSNLLQHLRQKNILDYLLPDWKTQVSCQFEEWKLKKITNAVISTQHKKWVNQSDLRKDIKKYLIQPVLGEKIDKDTEFFINPTGIFNIGWPAGDTWLTGRKIIVDTYWGWSRHGWGAFSWKDPTKVDRSWAYMARFLAKNIVAQGWAKKCEIQLSYAIGYDRPLSIYVNTFWTWCFMSDYDLAKSIEKLDLSPAWIIEKLKLKYHKYLPCARNWHFGFEDYEWEKIDKNYFESII